VGFKICRLPAIAAKPQILFFAFALLVLFFFFTIKLLK